jgi:rubrerythrin
MEQEGMMDDFEKWLENEKLTKLRIQGIYYNGEFNALSRALNQYRSMTCKFEWDGDYHLCNKCGLNEVYEPSYRYCPNCGRKVT